MKGSYATTTIPGRVRNAVLVGEIGVGFSIDEDRFAAQAKTNFDLKARCRTAFELPWVVQCDTAGYVGNEESQDRLIERRARDSIEINRTH